MTYNLLNPRNPHPGPSNEGGNSADELALLVVGVVRDILLRVVDGWHANGGSLSLAKCGVELRFERPQPDDR